MCVVSYLFSESIVRYRYCEMLSGRFLGVLRWILDSELWYPKGQTGLFIYLSW